MKKVVVFLVINLFTVFSVSSQEIKTEQGDVQIKEDSVSCNLGTWIRFGFNGPVLFNFNENGVVEGDFGMNQTIDIESEFEIKNDTIVFYDKTGKMCPEKGVYKIFKTDFYLAFDLIDDNCNGRIKTVMGYWTRPEFESFLKEFDSVLQTKPKPELYLHRARVYLAVGNSTLAKNDLDVYIDKIPTNDRAFLNRAATRFPKDLEGVLHDTNKALVLNSNLKNAYFLKGLAQYEMGARKEGCESFKNAIELGFTILKTAEKEKCSEFWENEY